jgi:hypothetical protein
MTNLTLSIDEKLLQAARVRAVKEGTSVNEVCRRAIENYARANAGQQRLERYRALVARMDAHRPEGGPAPAQRTNRADMYEQVLQERHPTLLRKRARAR